MYIVVWFNEIGPFFFFLIIQVYGPKSDYPTASNRNWRVLAAKRKPC